MSYYYKDEYEDEYEEEMEVTYNHSPNITHQNNSVIEGEFEGVKYLGFEKLVVFDWDIPHSSHRASSITFNNREEITNFVNSFINNNPQYAIQLYDTPGGMRGLLQSHLADSTQASLLFGWCQLMQDLKCDPEYIEMTIKQKRWWCRVSPKLNRKGDYTARYKTTIGEAFNLEAVHYIQLHNHLITVHNTP